MAWSKFSDFTSPGNVCSACGVDLRKNDVVWDTGIYIDWHGSIQICGTCIEDVAHQHGLLTEDQGAALQAQTFQAEAARARAERKAAAAEEALTGYGMMTSAVKELESDRA